jgi:hypothetical protein
MEMGSQPPRERRDFRVITERFDRICNESLLKRMLELVPLMDPLAYDPLALTVTTARWLGQRMKTHLS